jgi:hypothetical protein
MSFVVELNFWVCYSQIQQNSLYRKFLSKIVVMTPLCYVWLVEQEAFVRQIRILLLNIGHPYDIF